MVIHSEPPTKTVNMMMAVQSVFCFCVSSMVPAAFAIPGSTVAHRASRGAARVRQQEEANVVRGQKVRAGVLMTAPLFQESA